MVTETMAWEYTEVTAVFAADATARLTGIPGVAAVTAGPGCTNVITAMKNAELAESPVVVLGGARRRQCALRGRPLGVAATCGGGRTQLGLDEGERLLFEAGGVADGFWIDDD